MKKDIKILFGKLTKIEAKLDKLLLHLGLDPDPKKKQSHNPLDIYPSAKEILKEKEKEKSPLKGLVDFWKKGG